MGQRPFCRHRRRGGSCVGKFFLLLILASDSAHTQCCGFGQGKISKDSAPRNTVPQARVLSRSQAECAGLFFGDLAGRKFRGWPKPLHHHCSFGALGRNQPQVGLPPPPTVRNACEVRGSLPEDTPRGSQGVYSCSSRKSEGFFLFITNTQMLGSRFLFPERIQEILVCFCFFFLGNSASEDFLQNLLLPRCFFQVRTSQERMKIRAVCHWSVLPSGVKDGCRLITLEERGYLPWASASWGWQGRSSWFCPARRGPASLVPA